MHKAPFLYLTCGVRIWTRDDSHVHCSHLLLPPRLLLAFLSDPPLAIRFLLQEGAASSPSIRVSVEESKDVLKPSRLKRPEKRKEERGGEREREREREREKLDAHFREEEEDEEDEEETVADTLAALQTSKVSNPICCLRAEAHIQAVKVRRTCVHVASRDARRVNRDKLSNWHRPSGTLPPPSGKLREFLICYCRCYRFVRTIDCNGDDGSGDVWTFST